MNVKCPRCKHEQNLLRVYEDDIEVFAVCKECDAKFDIKYDQKTKQFIQIGRFKYVPHFVYRYAEI